MDVTCFNFVSSFINQTKLDMKRLLFLAVICTVIASCGGNSNEKNPYVAPDAASANKEASGNPSYDPNRGSGKFTHVDIPAALDAGLAGKGEKIFGVKCNACHKLTGEKLVG